MGGTTNSLLPAGFLSTSGGQVVDANGNTVRIQSIAWFGAEGPSGTTQVGMYNNNPNDPATAATIKSTLSDVVAEGFNTVRIAWSDVNLQAALPLFQAIVAEAGQLGVRVIFDHHDNDGHYSQQPNGLWFDAGAGTDGTDGGGDTGTISAAQFQADSVALATAFKGNSTVIGFDLHNEPLVAGSTGAQVTWGGGGPTDIQAMYSTVGSAVEAADPGALIIAEGPQNWSGTLLNGKPGLATEGDLSAAAAKPVTLTVNGQGVANKVVYSVHEYPSTIGGEPTDSGASFIQQMNAAWGYLEAGNIAPVWIGEIGASLDGTTGDSSGAANLANEQAWAATIVPYLNGKDAAQGGPSVNTSFDWWSLGNFPGGQPNGYNSGPNGSVNPAQQAVVSQLLTYHPTPTPSVVFTGPVSPDKTAITSTAGTITDASGNKWTITAAGQVAVNGVADTTTANVIKLAYVSGAIWHENNSNLWWGEAKPNAGWTLGGGTATSPLPPVSPPSANDTVVKVGSTAAIVDASGNTWTITTAGQVAVNGTADTTTANVTELAYVNGAIWQENKSNLWWGETQPNGGWTLGAGTATSPLPVVTTVTPSANNTVVKAGSATAIVDAGGNKWTITAAGQVAVNGTADTTTAHVAELAYVNKQVWQENSSNLWWGKTSPTDAWSPGAGTATSPLPASSVITLDPTQTSATISLSQISVIATAGNHMVLIQGVQDKINLSGGTNTITEGRNGNMYVMPAAGKGYDIFTNNILTTADKLDLRTALAATNWNGAAAGLASYLSVANTAQGAVLSVAPTAGASGVAIATIHGATNVTLSSLLPHAIT